MRAEGANLSLSSYTQFFSLGATTYDQHEGVLALEYLGSMNPQVWEEASQNAQIVRKKFAKRPWTKVLRNKFLKIHLYCRVGRRWASETTHI